MRTCKKTLYTVYSYVDISFQSRFYALRTQNSSHFYTMLYCASDVHRDRFEVTQCKVVDIVLCFHKFMDHVCLQMLIVGLCIDKYSN